MKPGSLAIPDFHTMMKKKASVQDLTKLKQSALDKFLIVFAPPEQPILHEDQKQTTS